MERYRKAIAALVGVLVDAVALGVLPASAAPYVTLLIGALTTLGVYAIPNAAGEVDGP